MSESNAAIGRRSLGSALQAPPMWLSLFEGARALSEAASLVPTNALLKGLPAGDGHAVIVLPGFLADDRSTRVLRRFLGHWGYDAHPWGLGRNLGASRIEDFEAMLAGKLERVFASSGNKVSLVGWSLGGVIARELARAFPQRVRQIVTLGSPISGSPRATSAVRLYERLNNLEFNEARIATDLGRVKKCVPGVPSAAIYSKSDAVVNWRISREVEGDLTESIGICTASHCGMGFNPAVLYVIADRLRQAEGNWQPFKASSIGRLIFS